MDTIYTITGLTGTRTLSAAYDTAGRVSSITYPGGEEVSYSYDEAWRQVGACSSTCYATGATYSALDQPKEFVLGNGLHQKYTYDSTMQRLQQVEVGLGLNMFKRDYTYDAVGNVATMTNEVPTPDKVNTYTYNHRDRLTNWLEQQSTTTLTNETYAYDAVGNITSKAGTSYSYGSYAHGAGEGTVCHQE